MSAEDLKNKGNSALSSGNIEEAIQHYTEAIKLNPIKEYYGNRSLAYTKINKLEEALADAEKCVEADPNWSKGFQRKGFALHALRRYKESEEAYRRGLQLEPNNAQMKQGLTDAEGLAKREEEQKRYEEKAKDKLAQVAKLFEGDPISKCRLMPEAMHLADDVEFVRKVTEIQEDPKKLQQHLNDERILLFVSVSAQYDYISKMSDKERMELFAKQEEEKMRRDKAEDEDRQRRRKEEEARKAAEEKRKREIEEARMSSEQRKANSLKDTGNEFYKQKKFSQALESYNEAHKLDPQNIVFLNNISATQLELKDYDKCIETCNLAIDVGRANRASFENISKALQRLGTAYYKKGDFQNAIENYKSALTEYRDPRTLTLLRQVEKSLEEKQKQEYLNPELSAKAKEEGNEFFKNKQFPKAVECYTEAIKRDPNNYVLYTNRATAYTKLGAFGEALKDCDKCLEMCPSFIKAYLKKGNVYLVTKQLQKCLEVYEQALQYEPENPEIRLAIEQTLVQINSGQNDPASVKRNLERDPALQAILQDPIMQEVLMTIKNGQPYQHYLKDPSIQANLEKLIAAGILGTAPQGARQK